MTIANVATTDTTVRLFVCMVRLPPNSGRRDLEAGTAAKCRSTRDFAATIQNVSAADAHQGVMRTSLLKLFVLRLM